MIFGTSGSKFQKSGSSEVLLDNSTIIPQWQQSKYLEKTSIINGDKNFDTLGDYSEFTVNVNLHKYADPVTKFQEIYAFNHNDVYFWPHYDGNPVMYATGSTYETASFHITDMKLGFADRFNTYDVLTINVKSKTYTEMTGSIL